MLDWIFSMFLGILLQRQAPSPALATSCPHSLLEGLPPPSCVWWLLDGVTDL